MKKRVRYILIIIGFLALANSGYSAEVPKSQWGMLKGNIAIHEPYYVSGPNKIRFFMGFAFPTNWMNELEINGTAEGMAKHGNSCHAQGSWRWEILPENSTAVLILTWYNLTNNEFGWCAIKNTKNDWYVSSKKQSWITQRGYTSNEYMLFHWISNGTQINISIRNPNNENGWTPEDIWYQFNVVN